MPIQSVFNRYQQAGLVGTISRPDALYMYDDPGKAAVTLQPGWGVLFDRTNGNWKLPTSAAEQLQVTHIVGTGIGVIQTAMSGENSDVGVSFAAGTMVRLLKFGCMYVKCGEAVKKGDLAQFDYATNTWKRYNPSAGTVADFRTKTFVFMSDGVANGIVEVSAEAQSKF